MVTALNVYGSATASTTLSTAGTLVTGTGGSDASHGSALGTATGYSELYALGNAGAWAASGSIGAPSGHGWLFDVTTLEGQSIVAGTWAPHFKFFLSRAGPITADLYIRAYKRSSAGVYTLINTFSLTGQSITGTITVFSPASASLSAVSFSTGDKLYIDAWANVTNNTLGLSSLNFNVMSSGSATQGVANGPEVDTPGYSPVSGALTATIAGVGTCAGTMTATGGAVLSVTMAGVGTFSAALTIPVTPLTLYATTTLDTTLPNAAELVTAAGASGAATTHTTIGTASGWGELGFGNSPTWAGGASPGPANGYGCIWNVTTLNGQTFPSDIWTLNTSVSTFVGTETGTLELMVYTYNAGAYTLIGTAALASATYTTTPSAVSISGTFASVSFVPGDKLYFELWFHSTAHTGTPTNMLVTTSNSGTLGWLGAGELDTPGYVLTTTGSPGPGSVATSPYGVTIPVFNTSAYAYSGDLFPDLATLGITAVRFQQDWGLIEGTAGVYNWTALDDFVGRCNAANIFVQFPIRNAPSWHITTLVNPSQTNHTTCNTNYPNDHIYQMDAAACGTFAGILAARYNGATTPNPHAPGTFLFLNAIEIGNEEFDNLFDCNSPATVAGQEPRLAKWYTPVVFAAAPAIKAASPNTLVGEFGMWWGNIDHRTSFLQDLYTQTDANGISAAAWLDYFNFHCYIGDPNVDVSSEDVSLPHILNAMNAVVLANGDNKHFWVTEIGWSIQEVSGSSGDPTAAQEATYYQSAMETMRTSGIVDRFNLFSMSYNPTGTIVVKGDSIVQPPGLVPHFWPAATTIQSYAVTYPTWGGTVSISLTAVMAGHGRLTPGTLALASVALSVTMAGAGTLSGALSGTVVSLGATLAATSQLTAQLFTPTAPPVSVTISGLPVFPIAGTLSIQNQVGRRSQASFHVLTDTSTFFQQYSRVQITNAAQTLLFSGYIIDAPRSQPGFQNNLVHEVTCIDQHYLADKRIVAQLYRNQTCAAIITDMLTNILSAEGVTAGQIAIGATVPIANFGYCTVADAMDALVAAASASGVPYYWQIDENKQLWFVPYTAVVGPTVDGTLIDDGRASGVVPKVSPGNIKYRNTQYAVGGVDQTGTNDETQAGNGQTRAFPFKYALAGPPSTFQLNGVTKTLGTKGQTGYQYYWAQGDNTIAQDSSESVLTSTDRLRMIYVGQFPSVFTAQNAAQVAAQAALDGTSGIVEAVLEDKSIASKADGQAKCNQQLTQYGLPGERFVYATQEADFAAGQLITVTYAPLGFSAAQMLVEEVDVSDQADGFTLWYTVNGVVGPYDTTWVEFFGNLFNKPTTIANSISLGVALNVPLAPSDTLAPSTTLAPG